MRFTKLLWVALLSLTIDTTIAAQPGLARSAKDSLLAMKSVYESTYAPTDWKAKTFGWSLNKEFEAAISKIDSKGANLTKSDVVSITNDFIYSMKDYHVSISYYSTEIATLPFNVRRADGKYFIVFIDKSKLGDVIFPFNVGDELVSFDHMPTELAVSMVKSTYIENVIETDQALAELFLTRRRASRGMKVPSGPVWVSVKRKGSDKIETRQLIWEYTPEKISPFRNNFLANITAGSINDSDAKTDSLNRFINRQMSFDTNGLSDDKSLNPFTMGTKKSFLPSLGKKLWQTADSALFDAYLYKNESGKLIGVVRIPTYSVQNANDSLKEFSEIISHFEAVADGLVIDQLNNPGGSVFYLYTLASMLSDKPLKTPQHHMSVTPMDVADALSVLNQLSTVKDDESAKKTLGETLWGYPVSYQLVEFFRSYADFTIAEWNAGKTFTSPYWIAGVDAINPAKQTFTKPILVLVNELDFSGGDFFPTILQDNNRAKIMGTRTAGAGGYVVNFSLPNLVGIEGFRVTQSLAKRVSDNPIENLGVTPDVPYTLSAEDFQSGFEPYKKAIQQTINALVD